MVQLAERQADAKTVRHINILELSLLFSKSETAKMKMRENKLVIGSRPVSGRDLSSDLFAYMALGGASD